MTSRKTVVVTGFRPFPGVRENPSALLVESLRGHPDWAHEAGVDLRTSLLDTVYSGLREQIEKLLAEVPTALVLTGYSAIASGLKIETRATSLCSPAYADASGWTPPPNLDPVRSSANGAIEFDRLLDALDFAGVPAGMSDDAGEYVCNHAYWHALDLIAQRNLITRALFVHLPAIEEMRFPPPGTGAIALATMQRGLAVILRELASS